MAKQLISIKKLNFQYMQLLNILLKIVYTVLKINLYNYTSILKLFEQPILGVGRHLI